MFSPRGFGVFISCVVLLIVNSSHGSEIINGQEVKPHSLPFIALLKSHIPKCGGILIDPKWVLTAAHCPNIKTVLLGVHSIKNEKGEKNYRQVKKVKKSIKHPKYVEIKKGDDLMLLKLDKPAQQTKWVNVLKLSNNIEDPTGGTSCLVAGWGQTNNINKTESDVLMSVNVTVIDREKCNSEGFYNSNPVITRSMICAGSDGTNVADTCQGDSGGPIMCKGKLFGVTSFGHGCGIKNKPGVYTFLTKNHLDWIEKEITKSEI